MSSINDDLTDHYKGQGINVFIGSISVSHRRTHGYQTYVRRPWLIVSPNLGCSMSMLDCPSA